MISIDVVAFILIIIYIILFICIIKRIFNSLDILGSAVFHIGIALVLILLAFFSEKELHYIKYDKEGEHIYSKYEVRINDVELTDDGIEVTYSYSLNNSDINVETVKESKVQSTEGNSYIELDRKVVGFIYVDNYKVYINHKEVLKRL